MKVTRPEPTIYGNCDSWSFIVGKKPRTYSQGPVANPSLRSSNKDFIHRLSTFFGWVWQDNMWAICGSAWDGPGPSRIVGSAAFVMLQKTAGSRAFYPWALTRQSK